MEKLFRIKLNVAAARRGGIGDKITSLPALRKKLTSVTEELAKTCVQAFQSKVPVDTAYLRNININYSVSDTPGLGYQATVFVSGSHKNRFGKTMDAGDLALKLNENRYRRSQVSRPLGPFKASASSETLGWIDEGRTAFLSSYGVFLKGFKSPAAEAPAPARISLL